MPREGKKERTPDMRERARLSQPSTSDIARVRRQMKMLKDVPDMGGPSLPRIATVRIGEKSETVDLDRYFGFLEDGVGRQAAEFICGYGSGQERETAATALAAVIHHTRDEDIFWLLLTAAEAVRGLRAGAPGSLRLLDKAAGRAADPSTHEPVLCTAGHLSTADFSRAHGIISSTTPSAGIYFPWTMLKFGIALGGELLEKISRTISTLGELNMPIMLGQMYLNYRRSIEAVLDKEMEPGLVNLISDTALGLKKRGKSEDYITYELLEIVLHHAEKGYSKAISDHCRHLGGN